MSARSLRLCVFLTAVLCWLPSVSAHAENIRVEPFSVETGEILYVPANNPSRYLVLSPEIVAVTEMSPNRLVIRGLQIGSSLVLVWEGGGQRSLRVQVLPPRKVTEERQKNERESSRFFRLDRERSFKVVSDTYYSIYKIGKTATDSTERQKYLDQRLSVSGATPYGQLKASGLLTYWRDPELGKSVTKVRDRWIALNNADLGPVQQMDLVVGDRYTQMQDFGFPGARYEGFTMVPSLVRTEKPAAGRLDPTFFVGRQRDGSFYDSQPGIFNRKQKEMLAGESVDYYLWEKGKISTGIFQQWNSLDPNRSTFNAVQSYDVEAGAFRFTGTAGLDESRRSAMRLGGAYETREFSWKTFWRNINTKYDTVLGSVAERGYAGVKNEWRWLPKLFFPWSPKEVLLVQGTADFFRDRLLVNPDHPDSFSQRIQGSADIRLPMDFLSTSSSAYEDMKSSSFPYVRRYFKEELSREWTPDWFWVKRVRPSGSVAYEEYTNAQGSPGFNSDFWEFGGGLDLTLPWNFWLSAKYFYAQLIEEEAFPEPPLTHPGQFMISGGTTQQLGNLPLYLTVSGRYIDQKDVYEKIHEPYLREDRLELSSKLEWNLESGGSLYVAADFSRAVLPSTDPDQRAELTLTTGMHYPWDTGFVIRGYGDIEGFVFRDDNANGRRDEGEPGLPGLEVTVKNGPKAVTDSQGHYRLDRVREGAIELAATKNLPGHYTYTTVSRYAVDLFPKDRLHFDFGLTSFVEVKGRAFLDVNENAIYDAGDKPLTDIVVILDSGETTRTAQQGLFYLKRPRPGKVKVMLGLDSIPSGFRTRTPVEKETEAKPGESVSFDMVFTAERTVSGRVFLDGDGDGVYADTKVDRGLAGIAVTAQGKRAETDAEGRYALKGLKPGSYALSVDATSLPAGDILKKVSIPLEVPAENFTKYDADFAVTEPSPDKK